MKAWGSPSWTGGKIQSSLVLISSSPADSDAGSYAIGGIASRAILWILGGSSPTFWSSSSSLYGTPVVSLIKHGSSSAPYRDPHAENKQQHPHTSTVHTVRSTVSRSNILTPAPSAPSAAQQHPQQRIGQQHRHTAASADPRTDAPPRSY